MFHIIFIHVYNFIYDWIIDNHYTPNQISHLRWWVHHARLW
jgi:hypothetical protein